MSVIVTINFDADPDAIERVSGENAEKMRSIAERARDRGCIAHRFYGSQDAKAMVVDEWPDAESFQQFFASVQDEIGPMLGQVGAGEPQIAFWRKLETHDDIGWGA